MRVITRGETLGTVDLGPDEWLELAKTAQPELIEALTHPSCSIWRRRFLHNTINVIELAKEGHRELDPVRWALIADALDYSRRIAT
jgi:hypothetical protein